MENRKNMIIGLSTFILIVTVSFLTGCNSEKEVIFEQVFNSISYFGNSDPSDIVELNANDVYIFNTQQEWGAFKERYLQGEPMPGVELMGNETIIFLHTKWEDMDWGTSYYIESMNIKNKHLNISIRDNGKMERVSGFPDDAWIHSILIYKVDDKNLDGDLSLNLIIEE